MAVSTRRLRRFVLGWSLLFGLVMLVRGLGGLQGPSLYGFDLFSTLLAEHAPSEEIVLIGINDDDMLRFGAPPYDDARYVDVFTRLFQAEPAAVIWAGLRPVHIGEGAQALDALIRQHPRWFIGHSPAGAAQPEIPALPAFAESGRAGHLTQVADLDNATRRILLSLRGPDGRLTPHLGLLGVNAYLGEREPQRAPLTLDADGALLLGDSRYPAHQPGLLGEYLSGLDDSALWSHLIPDVRRADYSTFSLSQLLDGEVDPADLRGRLLVVGTNSAVRLRPVMAATSLRWLDSPQWHSSLVFTAHQIDSLLALARQQAVPFSAPSEAAIWLLLGLYLALVLGVLLRSRRAYGWASLAVALAVITVALALLGHAHGWWLPWVPALALCLGAFVWRTLVGLQDSAIERERAGLLQRVIDSLPDPMCVIDGMGEVRLANRAFGRLSLSDQLGRLQLSNPPDADAVVLHLPFGDAELHVDTLGPDRLLRVLAFRRLDQVVDDVPRIEAAVQHLLSEGGESAALQLALVERVNDGEPAEPEAIAELAARELTQRLTASFSGASLLCRISPTIWLLLLRLDDDATAELQEGMRNVTAWPLSLQGQPVPVSLRWAGRPLAPSPGVGLQAVLQSLKAQLVEAPSGIATTSKR